MTLLPCARDQFEIPAHVAYINCAYMSPLSKRVIAAGHRGIAGKAQPWAVRAEDFFTHPDKARKLFAEIVGADSEGVAIVPAATYGMAAATKNLPVAQGEEILVLKDQMPANIYPWQRLADENGASIRLLEREGGESWTDLLMEALSDRTAIIAIPHVHWTDGAMIDLARLAPKARDHGAALVLDLTQSAGAAPTDLGAIQPDFAVAACYKWLTGPYSIGFLWVHPKWREGVPVEEGWATRKGAEDFSRLVDYQHEYAPGARRFDMGERSQHQLLPMAIEGMEQLLEWGIENIYETLTARTLAIADRAQAMGYTSKPVGERAGHYLGLTADRALPKDLVARMAAHDVHLSVRGSSIRLTPHLYNTDEDVNRMFEALGKEMGH